MDHDKHAFGNGVFCRVCNRLVSSVWADSREQGLWGQGICDDCKLASEQSTPPQPVQTAQPAPENTDQSAG